MALAATPAGEVLAGQPFEHEPAWLSVDGELGAGFDVTIVDFHQLAIISQRGWFISLAVMVKSSTSRSR